MKMKSVVLAAATAVASSAFAQIFNNGDVYAEWFATNSVQTDAIMPGGEFDTPLDSPIAITNTPAKAYDGYAVTAQVSIVVHAELPAVPSQFDNLNPKGAICAAVTNSPSISTNWYGLADGAWLALEGVGTPTEADHTLVMEFKDKGGAQEVRYSIDGTNATNGVSGWLRSGSGAAPSRVAFAGMGSYTSLTGILVNEKVAPSVSAVSWTEGYDFTNGTVSVTLGRYDYGSMGNVSLIVKDSVGKQVGGAVSLDENPHSANLTLTPGETYTYSIVQNAGGVVTTKDVGTFVAAAPGAGFSASAQSGISVVTNGAWANVLGIDSSAYAISGSEVFNIGEGALEANKLVIVDNKVTFTTWGDESDLQDFYDGTFAAITAVTNSSGAVVWKAYKGPENGWLDLVGGVTPAALNAPYDIRATFDFSETNPKMAFSMKASGASAFIPFTCGGSAWITSTVATNVLSEVGYSGIGKLTSVVGGNSDTNIAAVGATSYATLADAIAAATSGSDTVTLRTNTQWPSTTPVGTYTVLTNGFSLVGLPSAGGGIDITPSGVGFNIVVRGGSSHISGAGNIQIDSSAMEDLGIKPNTMTPAEIAAELTKPELNGIEKWANYVLGITGTDPTKKPFAAPVQNSSSDKLTFSLGGVNVKEGTGATVSYSVEQLESPDAEPGSGDTQTTNESSTVEFAVPESVKYYRVKVTITLPD